MEALTCWEKSGRFFVNFSGIPHRLVRYLAVPFRGLKFPVLLEFVVEKDAQRGECRLALKPAGLLLGAGCASVPTRVPCFWVWTVGLWAEWLVGRS